MSTDGPPLVGGKGHDHLALLTLASILGFLDSWILDRISVLEVCRLPRFIERMRCAKNVLGTISLIQSRARIVTMSSHQDLTRDMADTIACSQRPLASG